MRDGVFIKFADGKNALFPDSFFRAHYAWFAMGTIEERRQADKDALLVEQSGVPL